MIPGATRRVIARRAIALAAIFAVLPVPAVAYYAGMGKDVEKGNDCLIGYEGIDRGDVTLDGKKQVVTCTDCDPACDHDGETSANGACTFHVGVCINHPGVDGCTPPAGLDKAQASAKVKSVKGAIDVQVPQLLDGSACGALLDLIVPVKETNKGADDGSGTVKLSAQVKKNKAEGIKARKDEDKLTYVCVPRPAGDACPSASTTTTSLVPTTVTSTTTTTSTTIESTTSTSTSTSSSTSTTVPSTTSTTLPTTTSTTEATSSTSTSSSTSTTTSSSSITSTSEPEATTTSTSEPPLTTTTTSTTTTTVIPALCGNGVLDAGETCDDGNHSDNDGCPADCFIATCTPIVGTVRAVTVSFDAPANVDVAGLTLLLNYPEQKVFIPPAGPQTQISATYFTPAYPPADVFIRGADLAPAGSTGSGHAVRGVMADSQAVPHGPIFTLKFQDCEGAAAPIAGEFDCTVIDASDPFSNPLDDVTCSAALP